MMELEVNRLTKSNQTRVTKMNEWREGSHYRIHENASIERKLADQSTVTSSERDYQDLSINKMDVETQKG